MVSLMLQCITAADSITFVRMSPSQKAQVIELAKKNLKMKVLSIGDGYNDTQMLLASDCGIRITPGGAQNNTDPLTGQKKSITNEADFAITNFFQVQKLLFAHGYHSRQQISSLIYFYFYKNVVLVACEITFQVFAGFSRERIFIGIFVSLYNLVLTTLQSMIAIMYEHRSFRETLPMMDPQQYAAQLHSSNSGD